MKIYRTKFEGEVMDLDVPERFTEKGLKELFDALKNVPKDAFTFNEQSASQIEINREKKYILLKNHWNPICIFWEEESEEERKPVDSVTGIQEIGWGVDTFDYASINIK